MAAMNWVHPRKRTLKRWLESTDGGPVDEHVSTCRRCANRLEDLAAPSPALGDAISQTLRPPDDLAERLGVRMTDSMRSREDLQIFLDLLGVPWRTVQALMADGEDE
jgi:hypothetical protein